MSGQAMCFRIGLELGERLAVELHPLLGVAARGLERRKRPMPTDQAPMPMRPLSSTFSVSKKPLSMSPRRCSSPTVTSSKISSVVSEARSPILWIFLPVRKPGMPRSTMNAVNPFAFFSGLVEAITTNTPPTDPCVMKVFVPLITHLPSAWRTARVRAAPASEPEPGSVSPHPPSTSPLARRGRYFFFCASLAARKMCPVQSELCEAIVNPTEASARATSSSATTKSWHFIPAPPYSSGTCIPNRPISPIGFTTSCGKRSSSSQSWAWGTISRSQSSRTDFCRTRWSSVSSKSIMVWSWRPCSGPRGRRGRRSAPARPCRSR